MSYQDVLHAAMNELMKWVRKQGEQVVSLHAWPHLASWSELSDWSAHIDVLSTPPLHVRIKRKGYKFAIVHEFDDSLCPICDAHNRAPLVSHDVVVQAFERAFAMQPV